MGHGDITVQIMSGGRSLRMGRDKAELLLGGRTLLQRALETWHAYPLQLSIGQQAPPPCGALKTVRDIFRDCGPLGGLHAGLTACQTPFLLLCAVDMPFLTEDLAHVLRDSIRQADACVFSLKGFPEPLFGLYRKETCLPAAEEMLLASQRKMNLLLQRVDTVLIPWDDPLPFRNLNTPEDLRAAEALLAQR